MLPWRSRRYADFRATISRRQTGYCWTEALRRYGAALGGRDYDEVSLSDADLWNIYFPPFKAAIDAGAGNVMTAYMDLNGIPASGSPWLFTEVLREMWGFS